MAHNSCFKGGARNPAVGSYGITCPQEKSFPTLLPTWTTLMSSLVGGQNLKTRGWPSHWNFSASNSLMHKCKKNPVCSPRAQLVLQGWQHCTDEPEYAQEEDWKNGTLIQNIVTFHTRTTLYTASISSSATRALPLQHLPLFQAFFQILDLAG